MIKFHDVKTTDRELIQRYTLCGDRMNCDLSFANIISWRFLYNTQIAEVDGFLVFRFYTGHHLAYMAPVWKCKWEEGMRERFCCCCPSDARRCYHLGSSLLDVRRMFLYDENIRGNLPETFLYLSQTGDHFDYIYTRRKAGDTIW